MAGISPLPEVGEGESAMERHERLRRVASACVGSSSRRDAMVKSAQSSSCQR